MSGLIRAYLNRLSALLQVPPEARERILSEVEEHLMDAVEREMGSSNSSEEDATRRALERFGTPEALAQEFNGIDQVPFVVPPRKQRQKREETGKDPEEWVAGEIERDFCFGKGERSMWQRFTERTRRVIFLAQEEAARWGENLVGTEHLLLGLVRENDSVAARILDRYPGVNLSRIRQEIERQLSRGEGRLAQEMQLTPRAKMVIDFAYEEARNLNNNYIGSEHLLLGMIRETEGLAGRVLSKLGVELERARQEVKALQGGEEPKHPAQEPSPEPSRSQEEVIYLRTEFGLHAIKVSEIHSLRIRTASGEWLEGTWGGAEHVRPPSQPKENKKVIDVLVERGFLSPEKRQWAQDFHSEQPGSSLEDILLDHHFISDWELAQARAHAVNLRFVDLETTKPSPDAIRALPETIARRHTLIPVMKRGSDLLVAIANPDDPNIKDDVRIASGCRITYAIGTPGAILKAIQEAYQIHADDSEEIQDLAQLAAAVKEADFLESGDSDAMKKTLILLANVLLQHGIQKSASKIQIEPESNGVRVQFASSDCVKEEVTFPKYIFPLLLSHYKQMANLNLAERQNFQEGLMQISFGNTVYPIKLRCIPIPGGQKISMEIFYTER